MNILEYNISVLESKLISFGFMKESHLSYRKYTFGALIDINYNYKNLSIGRIEISCMQPDTYSSEYYSSPTKFMTTFDISDSSFLINFTTALRNLIEEYKDFVLSDFDLELKSLQEFKI